MDATKDMTIRQMSPQLLVADLERSLAFYTGLLGFELDFRYDDFYAAVVKNGYSIHLKKGQPFIRGEGDLDIVFAVENVEMVYATLSHKDVRISQPLRQMPYGKEFYIADPDGHVLAFVEGGE